MCNGVLTTSHFANQHHLPSKGREEKTRRGKNEREREREREKRARADRLDRLLWSFVKVNEKEKMSKVEEGRELPQHLDPPCEKT
ncbi:hypothetical protein V1478_006122 [Vespula squamosa]|uniref:Uncharacterized protein n=1 Tax=Vespula squamosa TaxID=30214 RepID=A0ABD2B702_VESSQ